MTTDTPDTKPLSIGITCYPTFGGSGVIATEIGTELARRGHRVHFISSDVPSRLDRFASNVFFHAVEVRDYPLFDSPYALALASKMVEVTTYEKLDLLHVHYAVPHATSAYLARQVLGAKAPKVVTTLHGTDITLVGNDRTFLPITRFSILASDAVSVPSRFLERATRQEFDIDEATLAIEVIPNFVDTGVFVPAPARRRGEFELHHLFPRSTAAAPRVLVHNSNFRAVKRVEDVVRVFERVRATPDGAVLVLIGDGPERSRVEDLVRSLGLASEVCFLGKQLAFVEVLQRSDVFLLPSASESFGLAALEAMSCGVPVVASRVGGVPEVVSDGETGFLVDLGEVDAMAAATRRILEDPSLSARMAAAARAHAVTRWPRAELVSRYEALYRRVLAATT